MAHYVDGFVMPVPKRQRRGLPPHRTQGGQALAVSTARWSTASASPTTCQKGKVTSFPRERQGRSPTRRWSSRGSSTGRVRIATASTPR